MEIFKKHWDKMALGSVLFVMFVSMFFSSKGDSAIVDEIAHIPAGYSYLTTGDYRLNPEHPPLIKDLAALPLLFMGVSFPYEYFRANVGSVNNQWETGWKFIYNFGNDPDSLILAARIPIMLLSLLLGYLVFRWTRELFGKKAAVLALILYAFDVNIIAHSRFVTTDLGISFALFLNLYMLYGFLKKPSLKKLLLVGLTFGIALISKFSAGILAPAYIIIFILSIARKSEKANGFLNKLSDDKLSKRVVGNLLSFVIFGFIGIFIMWLFYIPHTINLTTENQKKLIAESLPSDPKTKILETMSENQLTKPFAQYFLGFTMVSSHVKGGHDSFLLGQVSNKGWWYYYPIAILLKTIIPLFFIFILAVCFWEYLKKLDWFSEVYLWVLPVSLLVMGMQGSINLGIRYMLPIYPFIFVFVSRLAGITDFKCNRKSTKCNLAPTVIVSILMVWYVAESVFAYPHYLSYFNEFAGGYKNGYKFLTDSNTDWGQDLKRLAAWTEENNVNKIAVDYFGGGVPKYYLGDKYVEWHVKQGRPKGYFAVSATFYQNSRLKHIQKGEPDYSWLDGIKPVENIGGSILVYKLD